MSLSLTFLNKLLIKYSFIHYMTYIVIYIIVKCIESHEFVIIHHIYLLFL